MMDRSRETPINYEILLTSRVACSYNLIMQRHVHFDAPGAGHHLMVRGITQIAIFFDSLDRDRYHAHAKHHEATSHRLCRLIQQATQEIRL
jgi:hypothetical protein